MRSPFGVRSIIGRGPGRSVATDRVAARGGFSAAHPVLHDVGGCSGRRDPHAKSFEILVPEEPCHGIRLERVQGAFDHFSGRHCDTAGTTKVIAE